MRNLCLLIFLLFWILRQVAAQEATPAPSPSANDNSRVTVVGQTLEAELPVQGATTATRLPARILDTDRSISVINRQTLVDRAIDDPQEAIKDTAGVTQ